MNPAQELQTIADLAQYPDTERVELIGGEIIKRPMPRPRHGFAQNQTGNCLADFNSGGSIGGWVILTEIDVAYDTYNCPTHDLAGWRRERLPELPDQTLNIRPDWVCEILSPGHERKDLLDNLLLLQRHAVPYYWVISPEKRTLIAYHLVNGKYAVMLSAEHDEKVRIAPFSEVEFSCYF